MSEIIEEQIRYYRHRASEYDPTSEWRKDPFQEQRDVVAGALEEFDPWGQVLEIACGTGHWTAELVKHADRVTALDASPEMIALNRKKLPGAGIAYVEADVFSWEPDRRYNVVFFANWLSHVPPEDLARFWDIVGEALAPDGRVFFVDEAQDAWRYEEPTETPYVVTRRLRDGSTYRAVKVFWDAAKLEGRLRELGWDVAVTEAQALLYGQGRTLER